MFDYFALEQFVGEQLHRPTRVTLWRCATSQRNQERFLLAIHLARRTCAWVFLQGVVQTAEHEFLSRALNCRDTDLERRGDFLVSKFLMRHA